METDSNYFRFADKPRITHPAALWCPATDWRQIVALYNQMVRIQASPLV